MSDFWIWLLISATAGLILFPATYFYEKWEDKREGVVVSPKKNLLIATVMGIWPVAACIVTWAGIWLEI